jgi:hypothetical protein
MKAGYAMVLNIHRRDLTFCSILVRCVQEIYQTSACQSRM